MDENKKMEEQKFIENLIVLGKTVSIEASKDKGLEDKLKRLSSY